jgi:hypothetical protein
MVVTVVEVAATTMTMTPFSPTLFLLLKPYLFCVFMYLIEICNPLFVPHKLVNP